MCVCVCCIHRLCTSRSRSQLYSSFYYFKMNLFCFKLPFQLLHWKWYSLGMLCLSWWIAAFSKIGIIVIPFTSCCNFVRIKWINTWGILMVWHIVKAQESVCYYFFHQESKTILSIWTLVPLLPQIISKMVQLIFDVIYLY